MKKIIYFMCILVCSCLTLVSCQDDQVENLAPGSVGAVRVMFNTPDFVQLGTRATSESGLKDVTVLQYKDGKLVKSILLENLLFTQAVEVEGLVSIPASTFDENGKLVQGSENLLVFLANIKSLTGAEVALAEGSSYADFLAYTVALEDAAALGDLSYIPMIGRYFRGIVDGVSNQINTSLSRALAKVNFVLNVDNFKLSTGEKPIVTVNSIELHNVPLTVTFLPEGRPGLPVNGRPGEWPDVQRPYPAATGTASAAADGGIDADNFVTLGVDYNQAVDKAKGFVAYMPENARGSYANITSNKDKIPASIADEGNRVGLTYLLVDLDYETSDGVIRNATYKIYIGGDAAGDMNLLANTQYNVTTYLYGASEVDTRITVSDVFNPAVTNPGTNSVQPMANSYIINPTTVNTDKPNFTIPLLQARNGWRYIQASLSAEGDATDYVAAFDQMIESGDWTIETLWKTWSTPNGLNVTGVAATGVETASGEATNGYYATLTIPADIPLGNNCVIALKDTDGEIWWTWHLWITDYDPDNATTKNGQTHTYFGDAFSSIGRYYGKTIMDRNLGAMVTGVADDYEAAQPQTTAEAMKWYGLLYQWGRKDPFTNSSDGTNAQATAIYDQDDQQIATGEYPDGFPKVNNSVLDNVLKDAVQKPMNFYFNPTDNWTKHDVNLWTAGSKTPFDPCPAGWCVPVGGDVVANNPWAGFADGDASALTSVNPYDAEEAGHVFDFKAVIDGEPGTMGRLYDKDGTKAWYPRSGYRTYTTGNLNLSLGYYWSTTTTTGNSSCALRFHADAVNPSNGLRRCNGQSIRCIQQ